MTLGTHKYGIVRVWKDNNYGQVCSDGFNENAAQVVCKELGFSYSIPFCCMGLEPVPSELRFAMSDVICDGTEKQLRDCQHERINPNCSSTEYASVFCTNTDPSTSTRMHLLNYCLTVDALNFKKNTNLLYEND